MKKIRIIMPLLMILMSHTIRTEKDSPHSLSKNNEEDIMKSLKPTSDFGIAQSDRQRIAELLNVLLSNEYVLYTKTLKFHWNIKGKHFGQLHELFEHQYKMLLDLSDAIAERVVQLGFNAYGTLKEFITAASVVEQSGHYPKEEEMIATLLHDHEIIIKIMHEIVTVTGNCGDHGTNNMLSEFVEKHEKMAWMLRAHLE